MEREARQVTLSTLADGAADELFIDALSKVCENVADPNTDPKEKRVISLQFTITADEERHVGDIAVKCKTVLAGNKGLKVGVYFGKQDGLDVAVVAPRQVDLFPTADSLLKAAAKETT